MAYIAPEILDRVATGDDKYTVTELADGRKQLTPSPDDVSEPGTEINKALLDPAFQTIQRLDNDIMPYNDYWWRRRPTATSYTENRVSAKALGYCNSHYSSSRGITFYYVTFDPSESSHTIQVASAITINQSSGAISLKNPTSYSYTESSFSNSTYESICSGKYVKGLYPETSEIYYIPSGASVGSHNWVTSDGDVTEVGYEYMVYDDGSVSGYDIKVPQSLKNTAAGDWEAVSSPDSSAYPESGTSDGYDWAYLGKIFEAVAAIPENARAKLNSVSITSANFSDLQAAVSIPAKMALIMTEGGSTYSYGYVFGILDTVNAVFYGFIKNGESSTSSRRLYIGSSSSNICSLKYNECILYTSAGGLLLKLSSSSSSYSGTIHWLSLDSLEVG